MEPLPAPARDDPALNAGLPVLLYDGDCSFCVGVCATLVRARLLRPSQVADYRGLEVEQLQAAMEAGIHNEMQVVDPATGELRGGARAILGALRRSWAGGLARVLLLPPLAFLCERAYRVLAYNRRALAPPDPSKPRCACDPDDVPRLQQAFVVCALLLAALPAAGYGAAFASASGSFAPLAGAGLAVLAAVGACAVLGARGRELAAPRDRRWWTHAAALTCGASWIAVGGAVVAALAPSALAHPALAVSLLAGVLWAMRSHARRWELVRTS